MEIAKIIGQALTAPRDFGCCIYQGYQTIVGNFDVAVMYKLSLWDIGAVILLTKLTKLSVEFISPLPDIYTGDQKGYVHTVIIGKSEMVSKLSIIMRSERI